MEIVMKNFAWLWMILISFFCRAVEYQQLIITNQTPYPVGFHGMDANGNRHGSLQPNEKTHPIPVDWGSHFFFNSNYYAFLTPWDYADNVFNLNIVPPQDIEQK